MNFITGQKLLRQKEFGEALNVFLNLEKEKMKDPRVYFYLGMIYFELNNFKKSIHNYSKFLKKRPESVSALINLAITHQSIGELEKAKNIYIKLIQIDKTIISPYYGLFMLNSDYITDKYFKNILNIKKKSKLSLHELGILNFILSKKEKNKKNYKKEIEYLELYHSKIFKSNYSYNLSSQFYYNTIINNHFNKIIIKKNDKKKLNNENLSPIFIIGLPRSGSTLIESIITSSKEKIKSFGECHVINMSVLDQIAQKIYIKNFDAKNFIFEIDSEKLEINIKRRYSQFNIKKKCFVDKSLENFFNIKMILEIYPNAKFLHTFRNTTDSIISIYQSMLPELSWTHSIENILLYIDSYQKVINYIRINYPRSIMDINLEKFTNNSMEITKEIYKFCSLTWTNESLNFYKREDLYTKTLSFTQIRKKISNYNINKYQPYFHMLNDYKKKYKWLNL